VLETDSRVIPLHNVTEVINERFHGWVVFVVDVLHALLAELTLLVAGVGPTGLLVLWHNKSGLDLEFVVSN